MCAPGTAPPQGNYVVIKGENREPLWNEFKAWYLSEISATLNGWSLGEMMVRVLKTACMHAGSGMKKMSKELCTRQNAAKFAVFIVVMMGLQVAGPLRLLAALIGAYFTLDMIRALGVLLQEAARIFLNASTEAQLDQAGVALGRFFAQIDRKSTRLNS